MLVELRKVKDEDLEQIMVWRMSPNITKFMYTEPKLTLEGQKKWFEKIRKSEEDLYWIIQFNEVPIGLASINNIDRVNKKCSAAYYIGDDNYRGTGLAKNIECNMYDYVFHKLNLNKVYWEVLHFNKRAIHIHEKFGSTIEGVFKEHIFKNNTYYDVVILSLLKNNWNLIKERYKYNAISIE